MSDIISAVTDLVTAGIQYVGQFVAVITGNPLILAFVIISFVGLGIGLLRRLIRL